MLDNTNAQTQAIEDDDLDKLEELLSSRNELMKKIDRLDSNKTREDRNLSREDSHVMKNILGEIIDIDNKNKDLIESGINNSELELNNIKGELRKIREGKRQGESYGNEYGVYKEEGVFFDTKE